ncbi:hypothetical protein [Lonepinella sp. MS14435]|uniref:hypothetical protein n=1 Tax=Lonepinella sp. MS14435 TaxID=3003618 RepID=UPI0036DE0314
MLYFFLTYLAVVNITAYFLMREDKKRAKINNGELKNWYSLPFVLLVGLSVCI